MRLPVVLMTVLLLALLAGCGDDETDGKGAGADTTGERRGPLEPEPETEEPEQAATQGAKFGGQDRRNYEDAKSVCGAFSPRKVASDLGLDVDVHTSAGLVRVAEEYAADYRRNLRQAVFEGCLDGLPNP